MKRSGKRFRTTGLIDMAGDEEARESELEGEDPLMP